MKVGHNSQPFTKENCNIILYVIIILCNIISEIYYRSIYLCTRCMVAQNHRGASNYSVTSLIAIMLLLVVQRYHQRQSEEVVLCVLQHM